MLSNLNNVPLRKISSILGAALVISAAQLAAADTFLWKAHVDSNWDTATPNWNNTTTPSTNDVWVNANPSHTAVLDAAAATPGSIAVVPSGSSAIDVAEIDTLGAGAWTLTGGNITRAGGGTITLNVAPGSTLGLNAVITSGSNTLGATGAVATGILVTGGGTVSINTPHTFANNVTPTQAITVNGGSTLQFNSLAAAGTQNALPTSFNDGLYFDNGTLLITDASSGMAGNNTVRVGPGGITISASGSQTFSITSAIADLVAGNGGNVTITGTRAYSVNGPITVTGNVTIANLSSQYFVNNTYTGSTTVNAGSILQLRNAGTNPRLPTTTDLILNGALNIVGSDAQPTIRNLSGASTGSISLGSTGAITVAGVGNTTYAGVVSSSTQLIKTTGGNLTLSGNSTTTGAFTVSGGTITAASAGTIATNGPLGRGNIIINGGTLTSSVPNVNTGGTATGNFDLSAGTLDPNSQASVGSFTLNTNRNFNMSGGTLALTIASASSFDQIIQRAGANTAAFTITGGILDLGLGPADSSLYNNTYQVFQNFNGPNTVSGLTISNYDTADWTASLSDTGVLSFAPAAAVPEPASLAMLTLGAAALLTRRRK